MGGGRGVVKNCSKLRDIINGRPLNESRGDSLKLTPSPYPHVLMYGFIYVEKTLLKRAPLLRLIYTYRLHIHFLLCIVF